MDECELCVESCVANLSQIAEFVAEQARLAGLGDDAVFDVQMAVDEACTNSMTHGYEGRQDGLVHICCGIEPRAFVVRVVDYGRPFDPDSVPSPDVGAPIEERDIGGLGLYFMQQLMDSVEFRFDPTQGNQVIMRKHRQVA